MVKEGTPLVRRDIVGFIEERIWTKAVDRGLKFSLLCLACNFSRVGDDFTCEADGGDVAKAIENEDWYSGPDTPLIKICPSFEVNRREIKAE